VKAYDKAYDKGKIASPIYRTWQQW
jgi:hypothetical protein